MAESQFPPPDCNVIEWMHAQRDQEQHDRDDHVRIQITSVDLFTPQILHFAQAVEPDRVWR